jgi:hypothetical protein
VSCSGDDYSGTVPGKPCGCVGIERGQRSVMFRPSGDCGVPGAFYAMQAGTVAVAATGERSDGTAQQAPRSQRTDVSGE